MADLKIRVFKLGTDKPKTTITIPGSVLEGRLGFVSKTCGGTARAKRN